MAQLRLAKATDLHSFPGCAAVVNEEPPETECQETEIAGATGTTTLAGDTLTDVGAFVGIDLAGKILTLHKIESHTERSNQNGEFLPQ